MTTTEQVPQLISLSPDATAQVAELLAAEGDETMALRVAVRPGGCSGFSYDMFFDADTKTQPLTLSFNPVVQPCRSTQSLSQRTAK
jgi:Fe-S cluster assembly iron-binding protein IscA